MTNIQPSPQAAERGEPSYIWREGQQRRLEMIKSAAENRIKGIVLDAGCGVGLYLEHLLPLGCEVVGMEYDFDRALESKTKANHILGAAGEILPFPAGTFDLVLSNEVIEHVQDDKKAVQELIRILKPGGRLILFCPNRGYPFETHGIYWKGEYHFGNIPLVNYLPNIWRNKLVPHVRVYSKRALLSLFRDLPVKYVLRTVIFGGYDNIINRYPRLGRGLRSTLYMFEKTPFKNLGLSHYWVVEKTGTIYDREY